MTMKSNTKKIHINKLYVDYTLNPRVDTYNIPLMEEGILRLGKITNPLTVEPMPKEHKDFQEGMYRVLEGNRRALGGQKVYNNPACPTNVHTALESVECLVYSELDNKERYQLVFDHGTQEDLSRAETLLAVWKLFANGWTGPEIILTMFTCISKYTGKAKKLAEIKQISDDQVREKKIKTWLHGTVDNFMLAAAQMGEFIRQQTWLTDLALDRPLKDEEKAQVMFEMTRGRMTELSPAKTKDRDKGKGWEPLERAEEKDGKFTFTGGGEAFNALVEQYIKEDRGDSTGGKKDKRMTATQLQQKSDSAKSRELRQFYARVQGKEVEGFDFDALDTELYRAEKVKSVVISALDSIKDANVKALLFSIAYKGEAEVKASLVPYVS